MAHRLEEHWEEIPAGWKLEDLRICSELLRWLIDQIEKKGGEAK
jgi:hypothetical protein